MLLTGHQLRFIQPLNSGFREISRVVRKLIKIPTFLSNKREMSLFDFFLKTIFENSFLEHIDTVLVFFKNCSCS